MIWKPHVVVAALIEREGRFLLVEEETEEGVRYNQPAGHLEDGETLVRAVEREVLEETAWRFHAEALVGIYRYRRAPGAETYLRFAFSGRVSDHDPARALDEGILRAEWFTAQEIRAISDRHRSPLVARCIADYLAGRRYSLDALTDGDA